MKLVILCLFFAAAVNPIDDDWGAVKSFEDDLRLSVNKQLQNKASARIVNGKEARPKQFPYQAHLVLYKNDHTYLCGGSLISNRWVLTAAHCTDNLKQGLDVLLGAWNRIDRFEPNQHSIFVSTKHVILHEEWKWKGRLNDISLIKLPVVLVFNEYVQPVNLPKKSETYSTHAGEMSLVSGWGQHAEDENVEQMNVLRWTQIPVLENEKCAESFVPGLIISTNICLDTTGGSSPCYGDSGGPMVLADGSRTLLGLASFASKKGCTAGKPSVFTRMTSYLEWIAEKTGE